MATGPLTELLRNLRKAALVLAGEGVTDGQLLERYLARRDEGAFEALLQRHGPMVLGVCRRILPNVADAEDAFQATFLVLMRKASAIVPRQLVGNWLYGVAFRTATSAKALNARRKAKERLAVRCEAREEDALTDLWPVLDQELSRLPDKYRVAVVLCDLQGKTRRTAARQLGWPEGTLSTRLRAARKRLAKALARRGVTLPAGALAAALAQGTARALPSPLAAATRALAARVAAGQGVAGVISAQVLALAEGVIKSMFLTKLKVALGVLLAVTVLSSSALLAGRPPADPKAVRLPAPPSAEGGGAGAGAKPPAFQAKERSGQEKKKPAPAAVTVQVELEEIKVKGNDLFLTGTFRITQPLGGETVSSKLADVPIAPGVKINLNWAAGTPLGLRLEEDQGGLVVVGIEAIGKGAAQKKPKQY
jgi:RNA polymerase sigma factor (sigma-70 family)